MSKSFTKMGLAVLVLGVAGAASAQTNGPSGISGRIGAHFPRVGDTNFGIGLDYKFPSVDVPDARGGYVSYLGASVDWYGRNDNWNIPLAVTYNVRNNQLVFGAGIGVDFYKRGGDSKAGLGGQLSATYEFARSGETAYNPFFVQAKYFFANQSDLSGFGLYAGYRF